MVEITRNKIIVFFVLSSFLRHVLCPVLWCPPRCRHGSTDFPVIFSTHIQNWWLEGSVANLFAARLWDPFARSLRMRRSARLDESQRYFHCWWVMTDASAMPFLKVVIWNIIHRILFMLANIRYFFAVTIMGRFLVWFCLAWYPVGFPHLACPQVRLSVNQLRARRHFPILQGPATWNNYDN